MVKYWIECCLDNVWGLDKLESPVEIFICILVEFMWFTQFVRPLCASESFTNRQELENKLLLCQSVDYSSFTSECVTNPSFHDPCNAFAHVGTWLYDWKNTYHPFIKTQNWKYKSPFMMWPLDQVTMQVGSISSFGSAIAQLLLLEAHLLFLI